MDEICGRCGGVAQGYATINSQRFCHPDDEAKPDCYSLQSQQDDRRLFASLFGGLIDPGLTVSSDDVPS